MSQYTPDSELVGEIWTDLNAAIKLVESNNEVTEAMLDKIESHLLPVSFTLVALRKRLKNHQST